MIILLQGDNESSIKLVKNAEFHACIKHIDVQHHYIRELISERELRIDWISIKKMWADEFMKALPHNSFKQHCIKLKLQQGWAFMTVEGVLKINI